MTLKRIAVVVAACFAVAVLGWIVLIGAVYAWGGVATVRVHDPQEGLSLFVPVPMALVDAALTTSGWMVPDDDWRELEVELGEWGPMLSELLDELDRCPDVTLVEVVDGETRVRVYKQGGALRVEVDDRELTVRVSLPTRSVRRALGRLSRRA